MKKITLLGALLVSTAMQAQTFYWPGTRVSELTSGTQYFIYNTAVDGDRSWFLFSDGSALKATNVNPKDFVTTEDKYIFTVNKPASSQSANHWYMNSVDGIVGIGGQTNNTEVRDLYITRWFGNNDITKGSAMSEDENGDPQNPNEVDTKVFAITKNEGANTDKSEDYAWNGNKASDQTQWTRWSDAHPYAFYTVESNDVDPAAYAYYQELTARNGKLATFAFDMQKTYGLVQDGSKYYSNYKEASEGSYEGLLDGDDNTYFHSAYNNGGTDGTDPKHYLRAELSEQTTEFYFITKRRMDNNNNRPTSILVEGCNEPDGTYETITTISEGLPTAGNDYFYFSNKITSETAYKYIRFTPQTTSPAQTRFFTYSEFYVIEANAETEAAMNAVKGLYACKDLTVKDEDFDSNFQQAGSAFDAQLEKLELSVNKTEANKLLADNASNYNDDPALGQYPTEAYNALKSAVASSTTSDELTAAVKAFKFSINAPVFLINGAFNGGYQTVGKSIYYVADDAEHPLHWDKATNKYDKTMLWKFAGLKSETPELNTTYSAMNLSDQVYLWDVENMQITQTDPANEEGLVLVKSEGFVNPIHAQSDGLIVRYQTFNANSASAWTLQYVGESKNIEKIDDEKLAAYAELQTLIPACEPFVGKIGTGLNQFTSDDLESALTAAKEVAAKDIYEYPDMDVTATKDRLKAAKEALTINQPETGKFYRIKSVAKNKYVSSVPVADGRESLIDEADATTVFYLSDDKRLTNSIGVNLGSNARPAGNSLGGSFDFQINNNGYYMIMIASEGEGKDKPLYPHNDNGDLLSYDFNGGVYADKLADAWTLEEVNDETSQPKITKQMTAQYATVAAPVALNIPADVKAYTVKVDGEVAKLTEITGGVIPAGVAAVIEKTGAGESYEFTFAPSGSTANANDLQGVYVETTIPDENNAYVLANGTKGVGFYLLSETERVLGANKAYLSIPNDAAGVKAFVLDLGDLTGINSTEVAGEEVYYDLQGRRVLKPVKGIYVTKSGKKVFFTK